MTGDVNGGATNRLNTRTTKGLDPSKRQFGRWLDKKSVAERKELRATKMALDHSGKAMWEYEANGTLKKVDKRTYKDACVDFTCAVEELEEKLDAMNVKVQDLEAENAKLRANGLNSGSHQDDVMGLSTAAASPGSATADGDAQSMTNDRSDNIKPTTCQNAIVKTSSGKMETTQNTEPLASKDSMSNKKGVEQLDKPTPDEKAERKRQKLRLKRQRKKAELRAEKEELEEYRRREGVQGQSGPQGASKPMKRPVSSTLDINANKVDKALNANVIEEVVRKVVNAMFPEQAPSVEAGEGTSGAAPPMKKANVVLVKAGKMNKPDLKKEFLNKKGGLRQIPKKPVPKREDQHMFGVRIQVPEVGGWIPDKEEYYRKERTKARKFIYDILAKAPQSLWTEDQIDQEIVKVNRSNTKDVTGITRPERPEDGKARMVEVTFKTKEMAKLVLDTYEVQHKRRVEMRKANNYTEPYISRVVLPQRPKEDRQAFAYAKKQAEELQELAGQDSVKKYIVVRKGEGFGIRLIIDKSSPHYLPKEKYEADQAKKKLEKREKKNRENWEERQKFLMKKLNDKANSMNVGEENGEKDKNNDE